MFFLFFVLRSLCGIMGREGIFKFFFEDMKALLCAFVVIMLASPVFAAGEQPSINKAEVAATASYVEGAYNAMDAVKQDKLTSTNVVESGAGAVVTGVSASNGTVTVTRGEMTIPVGATNSNTRAVIWFE